MPRPGRCKTRCTTECADFVDEARSEYRTWIFTEWTATIVAAVSCRWRSCCFTTGCFKPLEMLLAGSRRIAQQDDFDHRIHLKNRDEMAELAGALNDMTARFQEIRDDLDAQVQAADQASRAQRAAGQRRLSGGRRGPRNQQPAGLDRLVRRIARSRGCTTRCCESPSAASSPPAISKSSANICA